MLERITNTLGDINSSLNNYVLVVSLIGVGVFLTLALRAVQVRHFGRMIRYTISSRSGAKGGISSFQAFAIGLATRIGIGNITGVALAMILGGPGAVFWMWVVASVGMATAFSEATLAQIFKIRWPGSTFRGGPAYYLTRGFGSRIWGIVYAILLIFSMTVAMPMVQANSITLNFSAHNVPVSVSAVVLMILTGLVVFFGVRGVAKTTEIITPIMALVYVVAALVVMALNLNQLPGFFAEIFRSAFGIGQIAAGAGSGILAAMLNGAKRGLFSNEAGMGTNPNAAATATVEHPVSQGLIQSFGVFIDTGIVCTATAFIIGASGSLPIPGVTSPDEAATLTANAITTNIGSWMAIPMAVMVFFFGYSSIIGAYVYAEVNVDFLFGRPIKHYLLATVAVVCTGIGACQQLLVVWTLMDTAMIVLTVVNLFGLLTMSKWVRGALFDYEDQLKRGIKTPVFAPAKSEFIGDKSVELVWDELAEEDRLANQVV